MRHLNGDERAARQRIESGFEERFICPVNQRAAMLLHILSWKLRGSDVSWHDVRVIADELGVSDQEAVNLVNARLRSLLCQPVITTG